MGSRSRIAALALGGMVLLAACSSRHKASTTSSTTTSTAASSASSPSSVTPGSKVEVASAVVGNLGQVLVDARGHTLYLLSSEAAGKPLTCTSLCLQYWPPVTVASTSATVVATGAVRASLLGTRSYGTVIYVTYAGYPLYTYSGDTMAGQANGEGIKSFGGTWYAVSISGQPAVARSAVATTAAPTSNTTRPATATTGATTPTTRAPVATSASTTSAPTTRPTTTTTRAPTTTKPTTTTTYPYSYP